MFCPKCGNADQKPEAFCRRCGIYLPDVDKLEKKVIPPEQHLTANSILSLMTALVSLTLAILLHAFFTSRDDTPPLIYITAGFLTAMFFWQAQTFWRMRQLKKHFPKRKKEEKVEVDALDTNPLIESAAPPSVVESTTRRLSEKPSENHPEPSQDRSVPA
ncbi:MAG: hypothetical protein AB1631_01420 [Acidobacteriota bacterium]